VQRAAHRAQIVADGDLRHEPVLAGLHPSDAEHIGECPLLVLGDRAHVHAGLL
jgi:hypothetical protein